MHKIVLLAINSKYIHSSLLVWALAGGVSRFARTEVETEVVEATINQDADVIVSQVAAHSPVVVGISTYIWNARLLPEVLDGLRAALPQAVIVLGGQEVSFNAEHWLSRGADYVLCGEGERSFPMLVDAILSKSSLADIPGLCRLESGRFMANAEKILAETPPDLYSPAWFQALGGRIAYLETSRGCPFSCDFCLSGQDSVRFFPLERAKRQLLALSRSGAKTIKLVDRTFNCNADRAYDLFEYVIRMDTDCCFHFEVAADLFDARTLALLKTAPPGRIQLETGLQSFYGPTLRAVSRRTDLLQAAQNIRAILSGGNIHLHMDLIAGLPLESFPEFQNSFDSAYALGTHKLQLGFLKVLHGSALRAQAREWGIRFGERPPYEVIDTPWISADELGILRKAEDALEHAYNSGRFLSTLNYVLETTGTRPFDLYRNLGERVPHGGMSLSLYTEKLYAYFCGMPGIQQERLRDTMVCDLLASTKGESLPRVLRVQDARRRLVAGMAAGFWKHAVPRRETAVLASRNQGVFPGAVRSPVTGRFELYFVELSAPEMTDGHSKKEGLQK